MSGKYGLTIIALLLSMFVCACGGGRDKSTETETPAQQEAKQSSDGSTKDIPGDTSEDAAAETLKPDYIEMPRPGVISKYDRIVRKYARRYLFDWRLISAQIYAESRFRRGARSYCGALGLMQIMPGTAQWLEEKAKDTPELKGTSRILLEPKANIHLGCYYDAMLLTRIKDTDSNSDRQRMMFAAYNAGPGNLNKARGKSDAPETWEGIREHLPEETRNYIPVIYDKYKVYKQWAMLKPY